MTDNTVNEVVVVPEDQVAADEAALEEAEWESDWGAVFMCLLFLVIICCGVGVAVWQPWI